MGKRKRRQPGEYSPLPGNLSYDYSADEREFAEAVDRFKASGHPFPTLVELLRILRDLGYRKEPVKPCQEGRR